MRTRPLKQWAQTLAKRKEAVKRRSRNRGYYPCRCRSCGQRRTFRMSIMIGTKCKSCGDLMRLDIYRATGREARANKCECGAAHYPHRKGWCRNLPDPDEDREAYAESCIQDEIARIPF